MPVASWPVGLPQMLAGTVTETSPDNLLRSSMEVGPAKVRRRTTQAAGQLEGKMYLTISQRATFDDFYDTTLISGSLPFNFPHPMSGVNLLVRFRQPPSFTIVHQQTNNACELSLTLEVLP